MEINEAGGVAPLLGLLNILDVDAQVQAATALAEMACDNAVVQAAIAKAGGIAPLLALLNSRVSAAQSQGMAALAQLARNNPTNQDAIAAQKGIKPLVLFLETSGHDAHVASHAAGALMEVTRNNTVNQQAVVDTGGVSKPRQPHEDHHPREGRTEVAGALWSLSADPQIKITIAAANTVRPLVELLGSGDVRSCEHAAGALASLGQDNTDNQESITQMLIELLINGNADAQDRAVKALLTLVEENPKSQQSIAKAGDPGRSSSF